VRENFLKKDLVTVTLIDLDVGSLSYEIPEVLSFGGVQIDKVILEKRGFYLKRIEWATRDKLSGCLGEVHAGASESIYIQMLEPRVSLRGKNG